jgi:hypothetical protein
VKLKKKLVLVAFREQIVKLFFVETLPWACGAAGSAPAWHAGGHEFKSRQVHHLLAMANPFFLKAGYL